VLSCVTRFVLILCRLNRCADSTGRPQKRLSEVTRRRGTRFCLSARLRYPVIIEYTDLVVRDRCQCEYFSQVRTEKGSREASASWLLAIAFDRYDGPPIPSELH